MSRRYSRLHFGMAIVGGLAVLALSGCSGLPGRPGPEPEVVRPSEVLDFDALYRQNCSGCHGAQGKRGAAVSLADPVYLALVDDATLRRVTSDGVPGTLMPAFARSAGGTLTERQIDVLVHEVRARWAKPNALASASPPSYLPSSSGHAARGAEVYQTFCASCHGPGGKGRDKAGSIVDGSYLATVSNQGLRTTVIVGVPDFGAPDWRNDVPGRPMTDQQVSDVVAWLAAQRPQFPGQPYASYSSGPAPAGGGSR
jgi:cytochrome c oxidase cbb3-type subunit III